VSQLLKQESEGTVKEKYSSYLVNSDRSPLASENIAVSVVFTLLLDAER
jgi:hypothetical protein